MRVRKVLSCLALGSIVGLGCGNAAEESGTGGESSAFGTEDGHNVNTTARSTSNGEVFRTQHAELSCVSEGDSCGDPTECCTGSCDAGVCAVEAFERCTSNDECSSEGWVCTQGGRCVDGTGVESATTALQADLNELPAAVGLAVPYRLPPNVALRIDDPDGDGVGLTVGDLGTTRRSIILHGNGSVLRIAPDITGLRLRHTASYSRIRDLRIDPVPELRNDEHSAIGIDVRAHGVRIDNLFIQRMGIGLRAHSDVDLNGDGDMEDPGEYANVNSQQWTQIRFDSCYQNAISMDGGDANAGTMTGIEILSGAGLSDSSFLGNTWVGVAAEGTHDTSIDMDGAAQASVVIGAYVERSDPKAQSKGLNTLWVGGNALGHMEGASERVGYHNSRLRFRAENGLSVSIPGSPDSPFTFRHPDEGNEWGLHYEDAWQMWMFAYKNSGLAGWVYGWTGDRHADGPAQHRAP